MGSPIGWSAGPLGKKSGAAEYTERAVRGRGPVVHRSAQLALPTIATLASPIGWLGGVHPRRTGAAGTLARAAHQQLEAVLENLCEGAMRVEPLQGSLALAPSSGESRRLFAALVRAF